MVAFFGALLGGYQGERLSTNSAEIRFREQRGDVRTEVKVVRFRKVGEERARQFNHRDRQQLGEFYQRIKCLLVRTGVLDRNDRALRIRQQRRDFLDICRRRLELWRLGNFSELLRPQPFVQHRFHGNANVSGTSRRALRHLANTDDALIERLRGRRLQCPFDHRLEQPLRSTDDAQVSVPLRARIELRFAIAGRLAGHHQHGCFHRPRGSDRHGALQQAGAGVEQNGLHPARDVRVSRGHGHGDRFVAAIQVNRPGGAALLLTRHRLPERGPFESRRGDHIFDIQIAECFEDGLAAVVIIFQVRFLRGCGGVTPCRPSISNAFTGMKW